MVVLSAVLILPAIGRGAPALRPEPPSPGPTVIEVDAEGAATRKAPPPFHQVEDLRTMLTAELARQKGAAARQRVKAEPVLVLRVDRHVRYVRVHAIMSLAKEVGFKDIRFETGGDR